MGTIQKIQLVARKEFEKLYLDTAAITETRLIFDEETSTKKPRTITVEGIPCKLDFKKESIPNQEGHNYNLETQYLLYVSPDVVIPEGSLVDITLENGMHYKFGVSGGVKAYPTHSEYSLIERKKAL